MFRSSGITDPGSGESSGQTSGSSEHLPGSEAVPAVSGPSAEGPGELGPVGGGRSRARLCWYGGDFLEWERELAILGAGAEGPVGGSHEDAVEAESPGGCLGPRSHSSESVFDDSSAPCKRSQSLESVFNPCGASGSATTSSKGVGGLGGGLSKLQAFLRIGKPSAQQQGGIEFIFGDGRFPPWFANKVEAGLQQTAHKEQEKWQGGGCRPVHPTFVGDSKRVSFLIGGQPSTTGSNSDAVQRLEKLCVEGELKWLLSALCNQGLFADMQLELALAGCNPTGQMDSSSYTVNRVGEGPEGEERFRVSATANQHLKAFQIRDPKGKDHLIKTGPSGARLCTSVAAFVSVPHGGKVHVNLDLEGCLCLASGVPPKVQKKVLCAAPKFNF